jgi:hypothetical protein
MTDSESAFAALEVMQKMLSNEKLKGFETLLNGVLASLFVVSVFALGLVLDLVGAVLNIWEEEAFRTHLERNKKWLDPQESRLRHPGLRTTYGRDLSLPSRLLWS